MKIIFVDGGVSITHRRTFSIIIFFISLLLPVIHKLKAFSTPLYYENTNSYQFTDVVNNLRKTSFQCNATPKMDCKNEMKRYKLRKCRKECEA
jgi:hypothetical protein